MRGKLWINLCELGRWLWYNVLLAAWPFIISFMLFRWSTDEEMAIDFWGGDYTLLIVSVAANILSYYADDKWNSYKLKRFAKGIAHLSYWICILFYFVIFNSYFANPRISKYLRYHPNAVREFVMVTAGLILISLVLVIIFHLCSAFKKDDEKV